MHTENVDPERRRTCRHRGRGAFRRFRTGGRPAPLRSRFRRRRTRVRRLYRARAGCVDRVHESGRHDPARRQPAHARCASPVRRPRAVARVADVAGARSRRWRQPRRLVSRRRPLLFVQRIAGPEARLRVHRQLRPRDEVRRRLGRPLLRAGGHAHRRVVPAVDRLPRQRQAVGRRERQRDVRHVQADGRRQQSRRARRPAQAQHACVGLGRESGTALRTRRAHTVRRHLQLAGEARLQRADRMERHLARPARAARESRAATIRRSTSA